jgi:hypothetical protein
MSRLRACVLAAALGGALVTRPASAQVEVQTQISGRQVEVGEPFNVQLSLMSENDVRATNARLAAPANVQVNGPQTSTQQRVTINNGRMQRRIGVTLTWTLVASKPGTYRIGPPSAEVDGKREVGQIASIEVLPEGSGASRRQGLPFGLDPFDPFGGLGGLGGRGFPGFPFGSDEPDEPPEQRVPPPPPEFQVDRAPDPLAFLNAKATPRKVVIGQAVSFKVFAYGGRGGYQGVPSTEASRDGFLAYDVDITAQTRAVAVPIGDTVWVAAKVREAVLFPIRTGTLRIGPTRFGFQGRGYPPTPGALGLMRQSQPIDVIVVEPPLAGRPSGYRLGDVGRYSLKATVDPPKIRQGEAVSVIAQLEGDGNVPAKLDIPQQNGVEWLEPSVIEKVDAQNGNVHGSRTFTYVVRIEQSGNIDLGELTLPYYDPEARRYEVARAPLGHIQVASDPNAAAAPIAKGGAPDRLKGLLAPRTTLGPQAKRRLALSDRPGFLAGTLLPPLAILMSTGLWRVGRRWRASWLTRHETPERRAQRELERAHVADRAGDRAQASAAIERAVHHAIEAATGLKGRGLLRSELGDALKAQGIAAKTADEAVSVLQLAETARFVQGEVSEQVSEVVARGEAVVQALKRRGRA